MTRRNWAAFYRNQQDRARRGLAMGQHRPDLADREPSAPEQTPEQTEDDDRD